MKLKLSGGGKIYRLPSRNLHPFAYRKALKKLFITHPEYKIFHAHGNSASICMDLSVAKKCGIPIRIGHSHNTSCFIKWQHYLFRPFLNSKVTHRFACSKAAGQWLFGNHSVRIIHNALDCEKFAFNVKAREKIRAELNIADDEILFGSIGGLTKNKNHKFILETLVELNKINKNKYKYVIVGEGDLREKLQFQIENLGLKNNVKLYGIASNVNDFYSAFDVFLFPSLYEGLPCCVIEAQACGLPVIMSNTITDEVVITKNVKSLPIDDIGLWVKEMSKAFERTDSLIAKAEIGKRGYNIYTESQKLQEFYLDIL